MENQQIELDMNAALHILRCYPDLPPGAEEEHPDDALLLQMTLPGGLAAAPPAVKHHLSLCPRCLGRWQRLLNSCSPFSDTVTSDAGTVADDWFTGGYLEACADHHLDLPLNLHSECNRFIVGIYGNGQDDEELLVTVDYCGAPDACPEGSLLTVNDRLGMLLLSAPLRNSRAAALLQLEPGQVPDLSSWTVRIQSNGVAET